MKQVFDLTRSKRPQMIPETEDLDKLQKKVDKIEKLIKDTEVIEGFYGGVEYTQLVLLRKRRIFDIIRESLTRELTSKEENIAWHNEVRGRLRESFDILDALKVTGDYKEELISKKKGLIASIISWSNKSKHK